MRKEVLFAIIFGIILGGVVLFGINLANKSSQNLNTGNTQTPNTTPTPTISTSSFEITFPQNHAVITDTKTTLSGKAEPNSSLAITTENDDLIISASPEGTYSAQINLIGGENTITVTNLAKDQTTQTATITVIQTSNPPQ